MKKINRKQLKKFFGGIAGGDEGVVSEEDRKVCRWICICNDNKTATVSDNRNCGSASACGSPQNFSCSSIGYRGNGC
ncbi:hypothetical protein HZP56_01010 [Elizabethkingia anophelis]|nr:hypothetical protein [Elizabethkingia anophelis]MCT4175544.1 hypothetical protein [Elizabethkingia anophelis]